MCNHSHSLNNSDNLDVQTFISSVAATAIARLNDTDKALAGDMFLTYGVGKPGLRGITYYDAWSTHEGNKIPFVEICAAGQSDAVQLAGTTIHEIGHVLAGLGAGHSKEWKEACAKLGLNNVLAAGTVYTLELFADDIRPKVRYLIHKLSKAQPCFTYSPGKRAVTTKPTPCPQGIGTRGGKSRGAGSGSRMLKFNCLECQAVWRMSGKWGESVTCCPCCKSESIETPEPKD